MVRLMMSDTVLNRSKRNNAKKRILIYGRYLSQKHAVADPEIQIGCVQMH